MDSKEIPIFDNYSLSIKIWCLQDLNAGGWQGEKGQNVTYLAHRQREEN